MRYLQYLLIFVLSCSLLTAEETELVDPNTPELAPWVELHGISTIPGEPVQPAIESWVELGNRVEVTEKEDIKTVIFFNKDNLEVMQCMTKKGIIHMAIRLEWMGSPTKADHVHLLNRDLNAVSGGHSYIMKVNSQDKLSIYTFFGDRGILIDDLIQEGQVIQKRYYRVWVTYEHLENIINVHQLNK